VNGILVAAWTFVKHIRLIQRAKWPAGGLIWPKCRIPELHLLAYLSQIIGGAG
jgi:hypothetical protein